MTKNVTMDQFIREFKTAREEMLEDMQKEVKKYVKTDLFQELREQSEEYASQLPGGSLQRHLADQWQGEWDTEETKDGITIGNKHRSAMMFEYGSRAKGLPVQATHLLDESTEPEELQRNFDRSRESTLI